jgi:hypothetical protein
VLSKPHTLTRELIDVGRFGNRMPVATEIAISQIIRQNENNVRRKLILCRGHGSRHDKDDNYETSC